jgi:hypothetical protein
VITAVATNYLRMFPCDEVFRCSLPQQTKEAFVLFIHEKIKGVPTNTKNVNIAVIFTVKISAFNTRVA